jgi:murein DD-endopeptidase MepM/ murein hydrolase activator NlpD
MKLVALGVLVLLFLIVTVGKSFGQESSRPSLQVAPITVAQGDCFFAVLTEVGETVSPAISWESQKFPMYWRDNRWQAILPAAADTAPGGRQVWVSWSEGGRERRLNSLIDIASHNFGIQHLSLPPQQESLYSYAGVEEEYRLIGGALKQFTPQALWQGKFIVPVKGHISTPFGLRRYRNGKKQGIHKGIDYGASLGAPVRAANDGLVALTAENFKLHGKTVVINHGQGVCTLYLHLSRILVQPGQEVKKGEIIARVGSTGVATGPHLHYACYVGDIAVNPAWWERAAR